MRDLPKRLDDAAGVIKYGEKEHIDGQLDAMRGLLREASERITLLETLTTPLAFSYKREGDFAHVKLEGELDMADVGQFLEVLAENV